MNLPRIRRWFALLLLVAATAGSWLLWRGRPERHLAEARRLLDGRAWDEAVHWLPLPEKTPATRERALLLRARVALMRGRPEEAVAPLRGVNPDGPWGADASFWKGRALYSVGNMPQAIAWFRMSLASRPRDADSLRWLAAAAYDLGDRRTVLDSLRNLTDVDPGDARSWHTLGMVTLEAPDGGEHELAAARGAFETSLRLDPEQPSTRFELAEVLVKEGRLEEAERQLGLCRGRVPDAEWADLSAGCAWATGDLDRCGKVVDAGLGTAPTHPGLLARRALLSQSAGRFDEAVGWFDRAVDADPYSPQWAYMRARALRFAGRPTEAARDEASAAELKKAVVMISDLDAQATRSPEDPGVRIQLGRACERLGKPEQAALWYRAALACNPLSAEARAAMAALPRQDLPAGARAMPGQR